MGLGRYGRILDRVLGGTSDANISFNDLCQLLRRLGFEERTRHVFRMPGVAERLNLQRDGSEAKPYQVRQVKAVVLKYRLGEFE